MSFTFGINLRKVWFPVLEIDIHFNLILSLYDFTPEIEEKKKTTMFSPYSTVAYI